MGDESDDIPDGGRTVFNPGGSVRPTPPTTESEVPAGPESPAESEGQSEPRAPPEPEGWPEPQAPAEPEGWPDLEAAVEPEQVADPVEPPEAPAPASAPAQMMTTGPTAAAVGAKAASQNSGRVEVGSVLNHIYQVTRFIARGGMGEVFEGANVNSDERVAIKVMLPQLAADPTVQEMFRKEARTLTKLSHPAVVQYRLLAQEPNLGVLYIVTEFIDGKSLADVMKGLDPSEKDLRTLLRRLAEGLRAAHELGAVHRDMSPDNVLLPDGRLDRAKIIDFGIAKDLDPSKATIVGDGFAGKLGYVAPEQFGDFDRQIGAWTDVYSLGLVVLAAALGRDVDMGATLVDAIDKRRSGPDLSPIPPGLRPVMQQMLTADPARRLRSMDEVIAALDAPAEAPKPAAPATPAPKTVFAPKAKVAEKPAKPAGGAEKPAPAGAGRKLPMPMILGGAAAALIVVGVVAFLALPKKPSTGPASGGAAAVSSGAPRAEVARRAVEASLNGIACSWLDLSDATDQPSGVAIKLAGVAGSPSAAQAAVIRAAGGANVPVADVNVDEDVAPAGQGLCTPLDAFRAFRGASSASGRRLEAAQRSFIMTKQQDGSIKGEAVVDMRIGDPSTDFALFGVDPTGLVAPLITSRADFKAQQERLTQGGRLTVTGDDTYRWKIGMTPPAGWNGLLLITGKGPFDASLIGAAPDKRGADWVDRIRQAAAAGGWRSDMVWYKTVDQGAG